MPVSVTDKDTGWEALIKRLLQMRNARVKVGILAKEGAEREEGSPLTKAEIAGVLEFGTENKIIPARPAVRSTFDEKKAELKAISAKLVVQIIDNKITVLKAMNILGAFLANSIKRKITDGEGIPPPNKPSTIKKKGSARTWVNTGAVLGAITWAAEVPGDKGGGE